ncbi:MAG TPA: hypothetical protein VKP64_08345 [Mycobacteriales bacterium]|nr:hypothetical protein [Mycobacteriales bacterium]
MTGFLTGAGERDVRVDGHTVRVSRLDRVLWPTTGTTKAELIDYYVRVAPVLLPHLRDRPVTLHRFPEGVGQRGFFQTRVPPHPPWVRTVTMSFPRTGNTFRAPLVGDLPSLVWAANLSSIELHPYLGRAGRLDTPTVVVFDLDPGPPAGLLDAAAIALRVREVLDAAGWCRSRRPRGARACTSTCR